MPTATKQHLTPEGWRTCIDTTGRCPYVVHQAGGVVAGQLSKAELDAKIGAEVEQHATRKREQDRELFARNWAERASGWKAHGFQEIRATRYSDYGLLTASSRELASRNLDEFSTAVLAQYAENHTTTEPDVLNTLLNHRGAQARTLYRAQQNHEFSAATAEELHAAIAKRFPLGGEITLDDVTTTTENPELALKTSSHRADEQRLPFKEGVLFELRTNRGVNVTSLAKLRSRSEETLLPSKTRWRVVAVHPSRSIKARTNYRAVHNMVDKGAPPQRYGYHGATTKTVTLVQLVEID